MLIGISYDTYDPAFANRGEMTNYSGVGRCRPCDNMDVVAKLNTLPNNGWLFNRISPVPSGADRRYYDIGTLNLATDAAQAANAVGELWVSYVVDFAKPKIMSANLALYDEWNLSHATFGSAPLGGASIVTNEIGASIYDNVITFPSRGTLSQSYIVNVVWTGSSVAVTFPVPAVSNATLTNLAYSPNGGETATRASASYLVQVTDPSTVAYLTLGTAGTLPTSGTGKVWIHMR